MSDRFPVKASGQEREAAVLTPLDAGITELRPVILWGLFFGLLITLLGFAAPLYMMNVYERVLASRNETTLIVMAMIVVFAMLLQSGLDAIRSDFMRRAAVRFDRTIAGPAFDAIQRAIVQRPLDKSLPSLKDVELIRDFVAGGALAGLMDAVWLPLFLIVAYVLHPLFAAIVLLVALTVAGLALLTTRATAEPISEAMRAQQAASQRASSAFQNHESVRSMGMQRVVRRRWQAAHEAALGWAVVADDRSTLLRALSSFTRSFSGTVTITIAAFLVLHRELSPGQIFATSIIVGMASVPLQRVVMQWKSIGAARLAHARLQQLFHDMAATPVRMELPKPAGHLAVEGVVVTPPGRGVEQMILRGVTFDIPAGTVLAIVGPSASGKSCLLRLLVNVWRPFAGEVRLDGTALQHWDADQLGKWVGYLPQSVELFPGTVAQNIARFQANSHDGILAATQRAGVHEMIQKLPGGYDTEIGEHGSILSGGQRQRIGLARALFGDPSLVVLDEPNANLDAFGETCLVEAIRGLKTAGKTVVFVTHKASLVDAADYVAVIANGTISDFGSRPEVMKRISQPRQAQSQLGVASR